METSKAILIELQGFLFEDDPEMPTTLKVNQKINVEALKLLLDMQEYIHLLGYYQIEERAAAALTSRIEDLGLHFDRLIFTEEEYEKIKIDALRMYHEQYDISCYIDEMENSPWKHFNSNLHRLKL